MSETAHLLAAAWNGGPVVGVLETPVETIDDGYAIQDALTKALGKPIVGWKLAQTTTAAQAAFGLSEATVSPLLDGMIVETGASFARRRFHIPEVEAEIVIELAEPLSGTPSPDDVAAAAAGVRMAIEVADTRYADKPSQGVPGAIADMNSCGALVVGPLMPMPTLATLREGTVSATLGDGTVVPGLPAEARPDPLAVVAFLTTFVGRRGLTLPSGTIVTTGTHTPPTKSAPGRIAATFADVGEVYAELSAPRA